MKIIVGRRVNWLAVICQAAFVALCGAWWFVMPIVEPATLVAPLAIRLVASVALAVVSTFVLALAGLAALGWFDATFPRISERRGKKA